MLINQESIKKRFNENLEWATEIDLATAWATIHDGLQALENHTPPLKVPRGRRPLGQLHGPEGTHYAGHNWRTSVG